MASKRTKETRAEPFTADPDDTSNIALEMGEDPEIQAFIAETNRLVGVIEDPNGSIRWDPTPEQYALFMTRSEECMRRIKSEK
jgi:hypothetical protein